MPTLDELKLRADGSLQPRSTRDVPVGIHVIRSRLAGLRGDLRHSEDKVMALEEQIAGMQEEQGVIRMQIRSLCADLGEQPRPEEEEY